MFDRMNELKAAAQVKAQDKANKTGIVHNVQETYTGSFQVRKGEPSAASVKGNWHCGTYWPQ